MSRTIATCVRVEKENFEWFRERYPWNGSFPGFVNEALKHFREVVGDSPAPRDFVPATVERLKDERW